MREAFGGIAKDVAVAVAAAFAVLSSVKVSPRITQIYVLPSNFDTLE